MESLSVVLLLGLFIWVICIQNKINGFDLILKKLNGEPEKTFVDPAFEAIQKTLEEKDEEKQPEETEQNVDTVVENKEPEINQLPEEISENKPKNEKSGFERFFLENIFNKIGALALIIGLGFFLKLVSEFITFTPELRIGIAALSGFGVMLCALKLHKDNMKNFAEVLMGLSIAILFITLYCATSLYKMLSLPSATAVASLLVLSTWFIAEKFKSFSTLLIGLVGGYLNPVFINNNISTNFLFGYFIFLNIVSVVFVLKNENKKALNYINLILAFITIAAFEAENLNSLRYIYPLLLWGIYFVNDIFTTFKNKDNENFKSNNALNWVNNLIFLYFAKVAVTNPHYIRTGAIFLCAAVLYFVCAKFIKGINCQSTKSYINGALAAIPFSIFLLLSGTPRIIVFALAGTAIAFFAQKHKYLTGWAMAYILSSFIGIFFVKNAVAYEYGFDMKNYHPIFNFRLALYGIPSLCAYVSSIFLKENKNIEILTKFLSISFMYLFALFEFNMCSQKYLAQKFNNFDTINTLTYTILGFIYSINLKHISKTLNSMFLSIVSNFILIISTATLLGTAHDNAGHYPILNIRFAAFLFAILASVYHLFKTKHGFYGYFSLILGFLCVNAEIVNYTNENALAASVSWIVYAGIITLIGIFTDKKIFKNTGIWLSLLAIGKIVFVDMADMNALYKVVAFLTLGIILMLVSYFYTKNKSKQSIK